jgi:heme exporter protein CcmD
MIATYASYVWACYGVTAAILILLAVLARRSRVQAEQQARRRLEITGGAEQVTAGGNAS